MDTSAIVLILEPRETGIVTTNVESFRVSDAIDNFKIFCQRKNVMMVVDESARIKNIKAKQQLKVIKVLNHIRFVESFNFLQKQILEGLAGNP